MKRIVYLFMHDDEESLELYEKMLISVLGKNEEAAVTKFKQLMQGWKSDKADSVATLIDHEESAIKGLKSLYVSTLTENSRVEIDIKQRDFGKGSLDHTAIFWLSKHAKGEQHRKDPCQHPHQDHHHLRSSACRHAFRE